MTRSRVVLDRLRDLPPVVLAVTGPRGRAEVEAAHDQRPERVRGGGRLRRRQRRQARHRLGRHLVSGARLEAVPRPRRRSGRAPTTTTSPPCRSTSTATATPTSSRAPTSARTSAGSRTRGKPDATWTYHEVDQPGNIEAAWMVDLSGDGVPDILPNTVNVVVWYEVVKKGDGKGFELKKHDFGKHGGRARRRLGRRQRRRPRRPAHAQGLVRGPGRPVARHLGLASRLAARRHRHPDPRPRRRRRRALRRRLRHGPRLRPVLAPARQGHRRRADLDQADDRQDDRLGPHPALGRHRRRRQGQRAGDRQAGLRPRDRAGRDRRLGDRLVRVRPELARNGSGTSSSRASRPRTRPRRRATAWRSRTSRPAPPAPACR